MAKGNAIQGDVARDRVREMIAEVRVNDPVRGEWRAPRSTAGNVWCDASDLAIRALLEIDEVEVEDAAWMRNKDDYHHINVAELLELLEAVFKGVSSGD